MCSEHKYIVAGMGVAIVLLLLLMWHMHTNGGKLGFLSGFDEAMCGVNGGYGGPCAPHQVCGTDASERYACA